MQDPEVIHVDLYSSKTEKLLCNGNEADLFFGKGYKTNTTIKVNVNLICGYLQFKKSGTWNKIHA